MMAVHRGIECSTSANSDSNTTTTTTNNNNKNNNNNNNNMLIDVAISGDRNVIKKKLRRV
jgi:hypothetical protein